MPPFCIPSLHKKHPWDSILPPWCTGRDVATRGWKNRDDLYEASSACFPPTPGPCSLGFNWGKGSICFQKTVFAQSLRVYQTSSSLLYPLTTARTSHGQIKKETSLPRPNFSLQLQLDGHSFLALYCCSHLKSPPRSSNAQAKLAPQPFPPTTSPPRVQVPLLFIKPVKNTGKKDYLQFLVAGVFPHAITPLPRPMLSQDRQLPNTKHSHWFSSSLTTPFRVSHKQHFPFFVFGSSESFCAKVMLDVPYWWTGRH